MHFKKILSALLAAAVAASSLSVVSSAQTAFEPQFVEDTAGSYQASGDVITKDDFDYIELKDGTLEVLCNNGEITKAVIPSTVNGKKVTSIGDYAFSGCKSLESISLPGGVTSIGAYAFADCQSLKSLTIPAGVTEISNDAFPNCLSITSFNVNANNPAYCSVNGVLFSKDKKTLNQYPAGKTAKSYAIPDGVTEIGNFAFAYSGNLTSVTMPNSVKKIQYGAFGCCENLTSITISNNATSISAFAFYSCYGLTSVTIPSSVTSIDPNAFCCCSSLTSITIPNSVKDIGQWAFSDCENFKEVYYTGTKTQWNNINIGSNNDALENATIHYNSTPRIANLNASSITSSSVTLSWCKDASANYYRVQIWDGSKWTNLSKITSGSALTYTSSGLTQNTSYKFRVIAYSSAGNLLAYSDITATTKSAAISNLTAKPGTNSVTLSWSKNASAGYYRVQIWKNNAWTNLTKTANNTTVTYTASGLAASTSYKFRVIAYSSAGKLLAYSDVSTKTTAATGTISNLKATPSTNSVKLSWNKNASAGYYRVQIWKNNAWTNLTKTANNTTVTYTASGLAASTSYKFRVIAYSSAGKLLAYSDVSAKTTAATGTISNLKATPSSNSVKLSWNKNASAGYYRVQIWKNNVWTNLTKTSSNATVSYTASGLAASTSYKFRVIAYSSAGKLLAYSDVSTKTTAATGTISNLTATPSKTSVALSWGKNTSAGYYRVQIWNGSAWTNLTKTANNSTLKYTASGLKANTSYKFRVIAYSSAGKLLAYSDKTVKTTA